MNRITKLTSAVMAAVVVSAAAVPASSAASAEVVTVEAQMLAGSTSISKMTIGKIADQAYTGKAVKPAVTVKNGGTRLKSGTDYTLTYKNNTKLGTASVTIKGKGKYSGSKTVSFNIVPGTSKLSVKTSGSKLSFSWSSVKGAEGYQLFYSVNGGSYKSLTSTSKTSYSSSSLDPKSNSLSFKVRAFKKSGGKTYYGAWSKEISAGKGGSGSSSGSGITVDSVAGGGKAGTIKYLGYYDIHTDQKSSGQCALFESDKFGGSIEYIYAPSGNGIYNTLADRIAADDSPDIVTNDVMRYPGNISQDLFEPINSRIDFSSDLWKGMKDIAENYAWKGKLYYAPYKTTTSLALNYSKKTIKDNGLKDPYELYKNGEWTWDAWRSMMEEFCGKDKKNIGFYAPDTGVDSFILTTGTPLISVSSKGKVTNNLQSKNVNRAMEFLTSLRRDGLSYQKQFGDWVSPQTFADNCDILLFLCMEPEWTYTAAAEQVQNPIGVENDILNTVSDFAFVPFPRDPQAGAYYQGVDSFGYLIPKGAKNIKGAVKFMELSRAYELDSRMQAKVRKDHLDPEKTYFDKGKYEGMQKWQMTWGEREYDLWREMCDPASFTAVYEDAYGFNYDFSSQIAIGLEAAASEDGGSWDDASAYYITPYVNTVIEYYGLK